MKKIKAIEKEIVKKEEKITESLKNKQEEVKRWKNLSSGEKSIIEKVDKIKLYNVFGLDTGLTVEKACAAQKLFAYLGQRQRQELSQNSKPKTIVGPILMYESWCRSPTPLNKHNKGASEKEINDSNEAKTKRRFNSDVQPVNSCSRCKEILPKFISATDSASCNRAISWCVYKFSKNS